MLSCTLTLQGTLWIHSICPSMLFYNTAAWMVSLYLLVIEVGHDTLRDDLQLLLQLHDMQRIVCGEQHKHFQTLGPGSLQMLKLMYVLTSLPVTNATVLCTIPVVT